MLNFAAGGPRHPELLRHPGEAALSVHRRSVFKTFHNPDFLLRNPDFPSNNVDSAIAADDLHPMPTPPMHTTCYKMIKFLH